MLKEIAMWFMPSSTKLASMAAAKIQEAVNSTDKESTIAKYAGMADKAVEVQQYVTSLLLDGRIDDLERDDIADKLKPLIDKLMELIG